jgi:hypothetical protein
MNYTSSFKKSKKNTLSTLSSWSRKLLWLVGLIFFVLTVRITSYYVNDLQAILFFVTPIALMFLLTSFFTFYIICYENYLVVTNFFFPYYKTISYFDLRNVIIEEKRGISTRHIRISIKVTGGQTHKYRGQFIAKEDTHLVRKLLLSKGINFHYRRDL